MLPGISAKTAQEEPRCRRCRHRAAVWNPVVGEPGLRSCCGHLLQPTDLAHDQRPQSETLQA
jgi:hypothetical protein